MHSDPTSLPSAAPAEPSLRRSLTLPLLTLYGLGVTVGAGIYVLIGATVAEAGLYAWLAFLLAAIVVGFTAFSYAELATRYPVSAGEAAYVDAGFGRQALATAVGLLVALSGMVSASAITVGAAGYLGGLTGLAPPPLIIGIVVAMGGLCLWGITQSVTVAAVVTVVEILGLLFVILWGTVFSGRGGAPIFELLPPLQGGHWVGILSASLLAFFAFIGFEDMVNVAEEVENPRRAIPRAIIYTLILATLLYLATCVAVLVSVPLEALKGSSAPLALVFSNAPEAVRSGFAAIAVVATVNGVLIQMIMASRVLYGMANRGQLPASFAQLSQRNQTPTLATFFVTASILSLSLFLPIERLAEWTSLVVLGVFVFVNLSLVAIKFRHDTDGDHFSVPILVPLCGIVTSLMLFATALF